MYWRDTIRATYTRLHGEGIWPVLPACEGRRTPLRTLDDGPRARAHGRQSSFQ